MIIDDDDDHISDDNNKLIKEELLKNNDIKEYIKLVNIDYDEIISLLEKSIKERYSINKSINIWF